MLINRFKLPFLLAVSIVLTVWPHPRPLTLFYPQFMLVSLILLSFFNKHIQWVTWACVYGLLVDFLTMSPLGWHALLYCLPVWVTCYWRHNFNIRNHAHLLVFLTAGLLLAAIWGALVQMAFRLPSQAYGFWLSIPASLAWGCLLWYTLGPGGFVAATKYRVSS